MHRNIVFIIVLLFLQSCNNEREILTPEYNFYESAYLILEYENVTDSVNIHSWHWNSIPGEEVSFDTLLNFGSGSMFFKINVNKPKLVQFNFNNKRFDLFFVPLDTTIIELNFSVGLDTISPVFKGKFASANKYYFQKSNRFNTWDYYKQRAGFTQSSLSASGLEKNNDDLTSLELSFLEEYKLNNTLDPVWFYEYEKRSILFRAASFKINSVFYRKFMLGIEDSIPESYYDFINKIDINNEISTLTDYYFYYLSDLISHQFRSSQDKGSDSLSKLDQNQDYYKYFFDFISKMDQPAREVFSMHKYFYFIKIKPDYTEIIDSLKRNIHRPEYHKLLDSLSQTKYQIPEFFDAPDFYLKDYKGKFRKLKEFQGKVVLLNFWSTSCIPCIKEFPFEKVLVENLNTTDFQLINICLDSNIDIWKNKIKGHRKNIIHLFAKDKWNDVLKSSYKIHAYPKFVLIDKSGKIINWNAPKPSNPDLEKEIREIL